MNPQSIVFLKVVESTVGALPAEHHTEFQFGIGESDVIGFALGVGLTLIVPWLWRRLSKQPTPWYSRRTVRIYDLPEEYAAPSIAHSDSGDSITWGNCRQVPVSYEGN